MGLNSEPDQKVAVMPVNSSCLPLHQAVIERCEALCQAIPIGNFFSNSELFYLTHIHNNRAPEATLSGHRGRTDMDVKLLCTTDPRRDGTVPEAQKQHLWPALDSLN